MVPLNVVACAVFELLGYQCRILAQFVVSAVDVHLLPAVVPTAALHSTIVHKYITSLSDLCRMLQLLETSGVADAEPLAASLAVAGFKLTGVAVLVDAEAGQAVLQQEVALAQVGPCCLWLACQQHVGLAQWLQTL
jgi:hypothetical protein